jgi:hypothetical protein
VVLLTFQIEVPAECGEGILRDVAASLLLFPRGLSAYPASRFTQVAAKQYWATRVLRFGWLEGLALGDAESQWFQQKGLSTGQLTRPANVLNHDTKFYGRGQDWDTWSV